jgi:catechol 2,3-dioxygenase-like lactoylglutathione lyase family enzyme
MKNFKSFTSFSIDDLERANSFYTEKLGLDIRVHDVHNMIMSSTGGDTRFMAYLKEDHKPADYTVLNFEVNDIESVVDVLTKRGVVFETVEGTNEKGIAEKGPTKAAWLKDPAGNWIGIFQED